MPTLTKTKPESFSGFFTESAVRRINGNFEYLLFELESQAQDPPATPAEMSKYLREVASYVKNVQAYFPALDEEEEEEGDPL